MPDGHDLLNTLQGAYATWGYPIVFLGALLENTALLGLILPGGTLVILGAIYAQQGELALPLVLLLGWLGMVSGTSFDFLLGRVGIRSVLAGSRYVERFRPQLQTAERHLNRYGPWAFLVAHFVGHIRSFLAITAGMTMLPVRRFLLYEGIAALVWNLAFITAGYLLGSNVERMQRYIGGAGVAVLLVLIVVFLGYRVFTRQGSEGHV